MPIRYDLMQRFSFAFAITNLAGVLFFAALLFIVPIFTTLSVRGKFTELDRASVINTQNLANMPESARFKPGTDPESYRTTVPDYLAASPTSAQRFAATSGLIFCLGNMLIWFVMWSIQKRAGVAIERMPKNPNPSGMNRPIDPDADTVDIAV